MEMVSACSERNPHLWTLPLIHQWPTSDTDALYNKQNLHHCDWHKEKSSFSYNQL